MGSEHFPLSSGRALVAATILHCHAFSGTILKVFEDGTELYCLESKKKNPAVPFCPVPRSLCHNSHRNEPHTAHTMQQNQNHEFQATLNCIATITYVVMMLNTCNSPNTFLAILASFLPYILFEEISLSLIGY